MVSFEKFLLPSYSRECYGVRLLAGIIGFFVCEDHILNTGNGLVTRSYLDELWSTTSSRIMSTLQTQSAYCTESLFMLKIKHIMLLFSMTLQKYGFSADKMYSLLHELRDHYTEVVMQKWVSKFRDIFEIDNYHPMQVGLASFLSLKRHKLSNYSFRPTHRKSLMRF